MVRLRMTADAALDTIGHGPHSYTISNSDEHIGVGQVDVPLECACILLRSSAGAVKLDPQPPGLPFGMVRLQMSKDASLDPIIGHGGQNFIISNSPHGIGKYEVRVPRHVAEALMQSSAGVLHVIDEDEEET